ncbi:MAG: T9SS type A sorting domain-containing protein [Paludibacter sp.]|nr:T9SS type A sorting domain-containing protein [Paludibacter sp.]
MKIIINVCLFCCLFLHGYAHRVWIVSNTNPVTSAAGIGRANKGDLKYCIEKYLMDDVITFAPELAGQVIYFETGLMLKMNASLTIDASNLSSNIIFDGSFKTSSPKRINILIDGSQGYGTNYFIIRGVTFQNICVNDYLSTNMGALYINHGTIMIENCEFRDNIFYSNTTTAGSSIQGAVICPVAGRASLTVLKCKFINNFGRRGSAISIWPFKETIVDACYFEANNTYAGGACVFINSSATETGSSSYVEIRNCTMTKNRGNAVGTLVSNLSLSNNAYLRIVGCTMVDNIISTTSSSTQMSMVHVGGRRLEIGGTMFGNNLNQNGSMVNDIALGISSSNTLPEDSLYLLGYNIFSELNNFGVDFCNTKLSSSPRNIVYKEWDSHPLTVSAATSEGVLLPSSDMALQNNYLCIIPREVVENWMFAPAYDQMLRHRISIWTTVGAYELNSANSSSNNISLNFKHKGIFLLESGASVQLTGFSNEYAEINLYNSSGQKKKSSFQSLSNPVRIAEFPSGAYIIRVKEASFKFVK